MPEEENDSQIKGKKKSRWWLWLAIIVVLIAIAAAVYILWRQKNKTATTTGSSQPSTTASSTPSGIESIDTSKLAFDSAGVTSNPLKDQNGPFFHTVYTATSTDGISFTATGVKIADHASVPDVIKLPSGQLAVYAVDGAQRSNSGLLLAVSADNGASWKLGSVQFSNDSSFKGVDPEITMSDNGQLRLFYTVFPQMSAVGNPSQSQVKIESATSTDGINFTEESGYRLQYLGITDPDVIKIGSTWFLYAAQGQNELYATSTSANGDYSYQGQIRTTGAVSKTVPFSSSTYRQYYCSTSGISSESSTDGKTWQNSSLDLAAANGQIICDPSPVKISDGNWIMIYKEEQSSNQK